MGTSFSVSPILIIIAITVGGAIGSLFGAGLGMVAGMIFSIPIVNVMKIILEEYMANSEKTDDNGQGTLDKGQLIIDN
jgi:predicted PurR-regulated permease PerM